MSQILFVIASVASSYLYAAIAAFGNDKEGISDQLTLVFELIFAGEFVTNLITSFIPDGQTVPVTSHKEIFLRYRYKGTFYQDVIALLPFTFVFWSNNYFDEYYRLFYLLKVVRINKGDEIFNVGEMMQWIKDYYS